MCSDIHYHLDVLFSRWMSNLENSQALENQLFDLIAIYYPTNFSDFLGACAFIKQKALRTSGYSCYQSGISVALIVCRMRLDFSFVLSCTFYKSIKLGLINLSECINFFDRYALDHLNWLLGIGDFREFCKDALERQKTVNFEKNTKNSSQAFLTLLAFYLQQIRSMDLCTNSEKEVLALNGLSVYAPLADKFGISGFKREIEDTAFSVLNPEARSALVEILSTLENEYSTVAQSTLDKLEQSFRQAGIRYRIFWRQKTPYSIWIKMLNKQQPFDKIVDVLGLRVIVGSIAECYQILEIIHSENEIANDCFDDFILFPKNNGYQSIHTVIKGPLGHKIEIQIRTEQMHDLAYQGVAAHWIYKNQIQNSLTTKGNDSESFLRSDLVYQQDQEDVYCTLSDGSKIHLSNGGTMLDIAFKISYEVGMSCVGAKVNGEHVSLLRRARNGDCVEILTTNWHLVDATYQHYVVDPEVKEYIKKYFLDQKWAKKVFAGERTLRNLCKLLKIKSFDHCMRELSKNFELTSVDELFASVGRGDLSMDRIISLLGKRYDFTRYLLQVRNFFKLLLARLGLSLFREVNFLANQTEPAKCCNPIPGDKIIGCFTLHDGFLIHWIECDALVKAPSHAQLISVNLLDQNEGRTYAAYLKVVLLDKAVSLGMACAIMEKFDARIRNIKTGNRILDCIEIIYSLRVPHLERLNMIISELHNRSEIYFAGRVRHDN